MADEKTAERKLKWDEENLLDTYSTANTLSQSIQLKDRILVEEIPSNRNYLTDIIEALNT